MHSAAAYRPTVSIAAASCRTDANDELRVLATLLEVLSDLHRLRRAMPAAKLAERSSLRRRDKFVVGFLPSHVDPGSRPAAAVRDVRDACAPAATPEQRATATRLLAAVLMHAAGLDDPEAADVQPWFSADVLRRKAVYVRQSTRTQFLVNRESKRRQYDMAPWLPTCRGDRRLARSDSGTFERPWGVRLVADCPPAMSAPPCALTPGMPWTRLRPHARAVRAARSMRHPPGFSRTMRYTVPS